MLHPWRIKGIVPGRISAAQGRKVAPAEGQEPCDVCSINGGVKTGRNVHVRKRLAQGKGSMSGGGHGDAGPRCRRHIQKEQH